MQTKSDSEGGVTPGKKEMFSTIKFEWKWVENSIKQEEKEIDKFAEYRNKLLANIRQAEENEQQTQAALLVIKTEYQKVITSDTVHFFNPSNFPADPTLDSIIAHAFSGGTRTLRALKQLEYITAEDELGNKAPQVFQKAFENYFAKKALVAEKKSWF